MSEGLSSDQLLDVLLAKISGQPLEEVAVQNSFQGQVRRGQLQTRERAQEQEEATSMCGNGVGV